MALDEIVTLAYGSGGKKTSELIHELLLPAFRNDLLSTLSDGAILPVTDKIVFSTDNFVIHPCFFPGGDIGKLSVCGTVNDLCMSGGLPKYLSLGFILEEGFPMKDLQTIVASIQRTAEECGVQIVTGDTKVVERGKGDGIYINTSGVGILQHEGYSEYNIQEGDAVIVSGSIGDHGAAIMAKRNGLLNELELASDCTPLHRLAAELFQYGDGVRVLRDPTRGGVATTLNEFIEDSRLSIELVEEKLPMKDGVVNACDMMGLDPLYCANEGKLIAVVKQELAQDIVDSLRKYSEGAMAAVIGSVTGNSQTEGRVILKTLLGGSRILSKLTGDQLPRIC